MTVNNKNQNYVVETGKRVLKSSSFNIFIVLFVMCVIMYIVSEPFRSWDNVLSIARNFSAYAITGIGVSMVIIAGGIDLSLGSVYGFAGVIATMAMADLGWPAFPSIILGMIAGALFGLFNGLLVVKAKLPPFIATLGTLSIARSLCYILTEGYPVTDVKERFLFLGQGYMASIPTPIWMMVIVAIIFAVFLNQTVTGRRIYALGGNEEATRISGINVNKVKVLVYTLCSLLAGFSGIMTASRLGIGQPTSGQGFELDAIAAVIIGGASLDGGAGTVTGTILGAAIMGVLRNALVLLSIKSHWQSLIIGFVIIIAVAADQLKKSRGK
ncbi:MAG: ABC transporter permease [Caldicoprobacterales bacterium]|jgi:ribose transport system permease protein|nr:ABC transporter permease [Clostridiales bacterium]